ncbi:Hypothetical protein KP2612_005165 [Komagataella phaffii]|nr:GQ67_05160T0 [Komagataella phaffii]AOA69971.1 GQ68_05142T1 [Komagataella phaffii GS115]
MVHQVKKKFFYGFVGLVVGATLYSMFFTTFKPSSRRTISKKQSKKKDTEVVKDDIPIDIEAKPVEEMSRTELFGFLAKRRQYPSLDTPLGDLIEKVKSIKEDEFLVEASI